MIELIMLALIPLLLILSVIVGVVVAQKRGTTGRLGKWAWCVAAVLATMTVVHIAIAAANIGGILLAMAGGRSFTDVILNGRDPTVGVVLGVSVGIIGVALTWLVFLRVLGRSSGPLVTDSGY